jgi:hypothetical protein
LHSNALDARVVGGHADSCPELIVRCAGAVNLGVTRFLAARRFPLATRSRNHAATSAHPEVSMPRSVNRARSATALACALGFALSACSQPASPANVGASTLASVTPPTAAITAKWPTASARSPQPAVVSWSCFEAGGCTPSRVTLQTVQAAPVVTAAPTALQQSVQGSSVSLGWQAPAGSPPSSYVIEAGSSPGASNIAVFDTGNNSTGILVNSVPNGTYYVRVRGRDAAGVGPASNEIVVVVGGTPGPQPPNACAITELQAAAIGSTVAVRWDSPDNCNFDGFVLGVGNVPGIANLAVLDITNGQSFLAENVPAGTYYLVVRTRQGATVGPLSNVASVVVTGVAPPGTSTWAGLVANGDGLRLAFDECAIAVDLIGTFVQTGATLSGFSTIVIREGDGPCAQLVGLTDTAPISGNITGSLADGSGTFTAFAGVENDYSILEASFANGVITGTSTSDEGAVGTFRLRKR